MIGLFLGYYSSMGGGTIGNLLFQWEQAGVFSYVLPFLLIFAIIYGILSQTQILGDRKGINVVIALAIGFMSLQFNIVSVFFSEIFPRMGIVLSIILVIMILLGLFVKNEDGTTAGWYKTLMIVIVLISVAIVVFQSLDVFNFYTGFGFGYWLSYNWQTILVVVIVVAAFFFIIIGGKNPSNSKSPLFKFAK